MKYLKIQNNGVLDIRLVALMGGTTKAGNSYKIGEFGTGLKYALAYLFRTNTDFKIFLGIDQPQVNTEVEIINENSFEILCINGHRTSVTTQMGRQWNAWMILRELWTNALDEGGEVREIVNREEAIVGEAGKTTFFIQLTHELQQVLDDWDSYFIHNRQPMWENDRYAIYPNREGGKLKLYKHGVLIYQHPNTESLFYYDIKRANINELREFIGVTSYEMFQALENPSQEVINYFLQNIKEKHYEGSEMEYNWFSSFAAIWRDTVGNSKIARTGDAEYYTERGLHVNFSNVIELPKKVYKALVKDFEGIGALVQTDDKSEFFEIPNQPLADRVKACVIELAEHGYISHEGVTIRYGAFREINQSFSVNVRKKTIMLSEICMKKSDREIINILVENNEAIVTGIEKTQAKFYKHFVNLFTNSLLGSADANLPAETPETVENSDEIYDLGF
jgi:hypothetical protein